MSLVSRLRQHLPNGLGRKPYISTLAAFKSLNLIGSFRNFSQPAMKEDDEEEIDQRSLPTDYDPATFDPKEHRSPPTERVFRLVDEISGLTLAEASELSSILVKRMGPVVMTPGDAMGAQVAEEEKVEKTVFELKLESYEAASKIKVIKEVRSFTELGLKEAKELVEKTPMVFKKGVSKEEAEQIIDKMKAVGAKVVME